MTKVTLITGNQNKADFLRKHLGVDVGHVALDLDEIQSLDLRKITEHKARQAYAQIKSPVLVEDVSLTILAMGRLPGPLIKWFMKELDNEGLCRLADFYEDRTAEVSIVYAYCDGDRVEFFEGREEGSIAKQPRGRRGFGWNPVFIPKNSPKTYAEMDEDETAKFSLRSPVIPLIKDFLNSLDSGKA